MRLIDADKFERQVMQAYEDVICDDCALQIVEILNEQDSVDPVKHGHWQFDGVHGWYCSECRCWDEIKGRFCSGCGAKMDEDS